MGMEVNDDWKREMTEVEGRPKKRHQEAGKGERKVAEKRLRRERETGSSRGGEREMVGRMTNTSRRRTDKVDEAKGRGERQVRQTWKSSHKRGASHGAKRSSRRSRRKTGEGGSKKNEVQDDKKQVAGQPRLRKRTR